MALERLPANLPVPVDDGAASHLFGAVLPSIVLPATSGDAVDLTQVGSPWAVIYIYPRTGRPGEARLEGWEAIPGARGCTPQTCGFRDHQEELAALGSEVYGLSTQTTEYQQEMVSRLHVGFPVLSDPARELGDALNLPTFDASGTTLYKRQTLIARNGTIEHVMYPVFPPDRNAADVVSWLRHRTAPTEDARASSNERNA